uniref:Uncharacterized protein n=1 Tax=Romanomermis culicivorax TaxID=13658 RepID=A0A915KHB2_ROMCU
MVKTLVNLLSYLITNVTNIRANPNVNLHCYSCMSPIFAVTIKGLDDVDELDVWENTRKFYNRPAKFTKSCNAETYNVHDLTLRNCTDACIWLSMENVIAGKSYRGYIRGCLSDLVDYNRTTMRFITYRAQCVPVTLKTLFAQRSNRALQYADQRVNFCACHSNRCNVGSTTCISSLIDILDSSLRSPVFVKRQLRENDLALTDKYSKNTFQPSQPQVLITMGFTHLINSL